MRVIPGIEFNTFSITARCSRTGMLGIAITTSDITVGSRCPYVMASVGAVSTGKIGAHYLTAFPDLFFENEFCALRHQDLTVANELDGALI